MTCPLTSGVGCDPRPPRGRRLHGASKRGERSCCDPRPPRGRRPRNDTPRVRVEVLRSTPPSREATGQLRLHHGPGTVAIHAPLAGGDARHGTDPRYTRCCDPRPPRGRRHNSQDQEEVETMLRSTPPSREATLVQLLVQLERLLRSTPPSREATISTSPLRMDCRSCDPRPPRGRRLLGLAGNHAAHRSCDPRPPRGRRRVSSCVLRGPIRLRSTPPSREATRYAPVVTILIHHVAIHAPLAGGDRLPQSVSPTTTGCDPRPPRGRRL